MAFDTTLAAESIRLNNDAHVRCLAWNSTGVTGVQSALVDHLKPRRREGARKAIPDSLDRTHIRSCLFVDHKTVRLAAQSERSATLASLYRLNRRIIIVP